MTLTPSRIWPTRRLRSDDLPLLGINIYLYDDEDVKREAPFRVPAMHVANVEITHELGNLPFAEFRDIGWSGLE
ncbi:hypothetical protein [Actinacidiphila reveromycinica]|uniref:hypothetical protein n=1 Tax=Actinacidiphila reveromycinica TaxID=659352 RepID=UPI0019205F74|nr:hypothetical protein [Streptomyces sp. SN-593]